MIYNQSCIHISPQETSVAHWFYIASFYIWKIIEYYKNVADSLLYSTIWYLEISGKISVNFLIWWLQENVMFPNARAGPREKQTAPDQIFSVFRFYVTTPSWSDVDVVVVVGGRNLRNGSPSVGRYLVRWSGDGVGELASSGVALPPSGVRQLRHSPRDVIRDNLLTDCRRPTATTTAWSDRCAFSTTTLIAATLDVQTAYTRYTHGVHTAYTRRTQGRSMSHTNRVSTTTKVYRRITFQASKFGFI